LISLGRSTIKYLFWSRLKSRIFLCGQCLGAGFAYSVNFAAGRAAGGGGCPQRVEMEGELRGLDFPARRPRPRVAPARRFCLDPSVQPQILSQEPPVYALLTQILQYNRPIMPLYPPVAAKNRRFYGCGAILRAHLVHNHVGSKFRECLKEPVSLSVGLFRAA
jgi:hypothetical protein